jgi:hypothetical protein
MKRPLSTVPYDIIMQFSVAYRMAPLSCLGPGYDVHAGSGLAVSVTRVAVVLTQIERISGFVVVNVDPSIIFFSLMFAIII